MREHTLISQVAAMLIHGTMDNKWSKADLAKLCAEYYGREAIKSEKLGGTSEAAHFSMMASQLEELAK